MNIELLTEEQREEWAKRNIKEEKTLSFTRRHVFTLDCGLVSFYEFMYTNGKYYLLLDPPDYDKIFIRGKNA